MKMVESNEPPYHTSLQNLTVLQHNCWVRNLVFLTLFSLIRNRNVSFVCLQDPLLFQGDPLRAPGYQCFSSHVSGQKKRVATYVNCFLTACFNYLCVSPIADVLHLLMSRNDGGKVVGENERLSLINTYNRQVDGNNTVSPTNLFTDNTNPSLIVGDLSVHTMYTDPERDMSTAERRKGAHYIRVARLHGYAILNKPGIYTTTPDDNTTRPSVIDYTLANNQLPEFVKTWRTNIPHTGSDHRAIITTISWTTFTPTRPSPNWNRITWKTGGEANTVIEDELKVLMGNESEGRNCTLFKGTKEGDPENAVEDFEHNLSLLIHTIKKYPPIKRPCKGSKLWWSPELTQLRKDFTVKTRKAMEDPRGMDNANQAKSKYQKEVKRAKATHRRPFLENAKKNDLWTTHQFTKKRLGSTVPGGHNYLSAALLNLAIMQHFFPQNPNPVDMEPPRYIELEEKDTVDASEVAQAL